MKCSRGALFAALLAAGWLLFSVSPLFAASPLRTLPANETPADARLQPLKDLNGYFPFTPSPSKQAWESRAAELRRNMLVALGLWPMPARTPLNAVVHGKRDLGEYTIEKVYFESLPGFFVTGSLYRPKGVEGRLPVVLSPHGHWSNGRFYDKGEAGAKGDLASGAEQLMSAARSPLQARCVQLARMGCLVFHYDMIGYADSRQITFEIAHRFAKQRPEFNAAENWGLFSPQAESHAQSVMGLQAFNSIRALDFVTALPDVDPRRIAVTGASGGGTQTFILCAIDPRPAVAAPAVMVSTAMQGGCTCENACGLRSAAGNVDFAALFAPKPLALTAADDWTREMPTKGFPELQQHYRLLGAPDNVMLKAALEFGHNYNQISRMAIYGWLNRHLQLQADEPIQERDFERQEAAQLTVWDDQHPRPPGGAELERRLLRHWHEDAQSQLSAARSQSPARYRELVGSGVDAVLRRGLPDPLQIEYEQTGKFDRGEHLELLGLLRNRERGEELPIAFLYPKAWESRVVIWLSEEGKAGLVDAQGAPLPPIQRLLDAGVAVTGVDLLYQGEFLKAGEKVEETRRVANTREAAAYTFGYNDSLFARRVHDVLTTIAFVRNHEYTPEQVDLVGFGPMGPLAAAARAQARGAVTRAAVETGGFRFARVRQLHDFNFLPGGAKYDDLPGMLALAAPARLWLAGEGPRAAEPLRAAYAASRKSLEVYPGKADKAQQAAVTWLLGP